MARQTIRLFFVIFWDAPASFWADDGARWKDRESPKWSGFITLTPWMSVQNVMAIHLIIVQRLQSGLMWWTDWPNTLQTNIVIHRVMQRSLQGLLFFQWKISMICLYLSSRYSWQPEKEFWFLVTYWSFLQCHHWAKMSSWAQNISQLNNII